MLQWLSVMAEQHSLLPAGTPTALQARRVFERSLIASLCQPEHAASLGFNLRSITIAASAVRERLSHEQWSLTVRAEREFFDRSKEFVHAGEYSTVDALRVLEDTSAHLAASVTIVVFTIIACSFSAAILYGNCRSHCS